MMSTEATSQAISVMDPITIQLSKERTSPRKTNSATPYAAIPAAQEISSRGTVRTY